MVLNSQSYQGLNSLNLQLNDVLNLLDSTPAEDEGSDDLVSKLHELVSQRQGIIDELIVDDSMTNSDYLETEFRLTNEFIKQVKKVMQHRHDLLQLGQKGRKHINVYKSIDSNR